MQFDRDFDQASDSISLQFSGELSCKSLIFGKVKSLSHV